MKLENIRIVLVNTTHPGNIGGVARAMKNMGLADLSLVVPRVFPSGDADARAAGASDILESASIVGSLEEAVADAHVVVGASARGRNIPWPVMDPHELAGVAASLQEEQKIAIVFGREDRGLTNEELQLCHLHVHIPSVEGFSSLNLAAAVQVIAYELRMVQLKGSQGQLQAPKWGTDWDVRLAEHRELELMFDHLEKVLIDIDFLDPESPRHLMPRLRRLFQRAVPDKVEVNILGGMWPHIQKKNDLS
ncbi:MAG: RNA methyltransferase [Pseudomonadales bacterium]